MEVAGDPGALGLGAEAAQAQEPERVVDRERERAGETGQQADVVGAVAGAVVEEGVDRRLRPHVVQGLDDPLGASVRHEVLVREGDLHRPRRRSRRTRATKTGSTR